jgi:hypothetical protein
MALIEFDRVVKRYPGAAAPAVDRLDLHIEAGGEHRLPAEGA